MSIALSTIETALREWVRDESGLGDDKVIWLNQDAPRPPLPYIALQIFGLVKVHEDYKPMPQNDDGDIKITGNRDFTLNIQHFGPGFLLSLETVRSSADKEAVRETLRAAGVAIWNTNEAIQDLTSLIETRYLDQASIDIMCRTNSEVADTLGTIQTVEVEGNYTNCAGDIVYNDNFTIETN